MPAASLQALDLIEKMLKYDPKRVIFEELSFIFQRISAKQALYHPFFTSNIPIPIMPSGKF